MLLRIVAHFCGSYSGFKKHVGFRATNSVVYKMFMKVSKNVVWQRVHVSTIQYVYKAYTYKLYTFDKWFIVYLLSNPRPSLNRVRRLNDHTKLYLALSHCISSYDYRNKHALLLCNLYMVNSLHWNIKFFLKIPIKTCHF